VFLSQELKCDGEKKCVNKDKTVIFEQTQDITHNNTQSDSADKIIETRRTSTTYKKKNQAQGVMIVYGEQGT